MTPATEGATADVPLVEVPVRRARPLVLWLVGVVVVAVGAGVLAGYGAAALSLAGADEYDEWAGLAAAIVGVLAGLAVGVGVLVVGTVVAVRRAAPVGRRLVTAVVFLVVGVAFAVTGPFTLLAAVPAAVLVAGLALRPGRWVAVGCVPLVLLVVGLAARTIDDHRRLEASYRVAAPWALVDGSTLDVDGWRLAGVGGPSSYRAGAQVRWFTEDDGYATLDLLTDVRFACPERTEPRGCRQAGALADGTPIWVEDTSTFGRRHWVSLPDGSWTVQTTREESSPTALALLQRLQRVTVGRFRAAADDA